MAFGVDYSQGYNIQDLKNGKVTFAARYIGFTSSTLPQTKIITYSEARDLLSAGISIVSNWEWTADRASVNNGFFNGRSSAAQSGGASDARQAASLHASIGGPPDRPIYFSIDYSTNGTDCIDYFKGVVSVLGLKRSGAYGPPIALAYLKSKGLISWTWGWTAASGLNIQQTGTDIRLGSIVVDTDESLTDDFGQWGTSQGGLPAASWFQYPIVVPFGNSQFDTGIGGSHDLTVGAPPNLPVISIVDGQLVSIDSPSWGKQVGIQLSMPYDGHDYASFLHLSAVNPALSIGMQVVKYKTLLGWVGGASAEDQMLGTRNPTGSNFLDEPEMSSQVQVGFALMDGQSYGFDGWTNFPPIDYTLNPTSILWQARIDNPPHIGVHMSPGELKQFTDTFNASNSGIDLSTDDVAKLWLNTYQPVYDFGPPVYRFNTTDWNDNPITITRFLSGKAERQDNGATRWWYLGHEVTFATS